MSIGAKIISSLAQGTIFSGLVGGLHSAFTDKSWNLQDQLKLTGFWLTFVVPTGIVWSSATRALMMRFGGRPEMFINIGTNNYRAITTDFILNQCLYQGIVITALYKYLDYIQIKECKLPKKQESSELKGEVRPSGNEAEEELPLDEDPYNSYNNVALMSGRLKIIFASYGIDALAPRVSETYRKRSQPYFFKNLLLSLLWYNFALHYYYYPATGHDFKLPLAVDKSKEEK